MIHTCAFYESISANTTKEVSVIPDDILTRTADTRFMVPNDFARVDSAIVYKDTQIALPRIFSPSLETRKIYKRLFPVNSWNDDGQNVLIDQKSVTLVPTEEFTVIAQNTDSANARNVLVVLNLGNKEPVEADDVLIALATGSTTLSPYKWTSVKVVPEIALEAGSYQLLGFIPISAGCICARVLISGQVARPGFPGIKASSINNLKLGNLYDAFKFQNCGVFPHTAIPEFQFLSTSADTSQYVIMFLKKT
jgi:hypothetical protein